jgi:hypothetical protein
MSWWGASGWAVAVGRRARLRSDGSSLTTRNTLLVFGLSAWVYFVFSTLPYVVPLPQAAGGERPRAESAGHGGAALAALRALAAVTHREDFHRDSLMVAAEAAAGGATLAPETARRGAAGRAEGLDAAYGHAGTAVLSIEDQATGEEEGGGGGEAEAVEEQGEDGDGEGEGEADAVDSDGLMVHSDPPLPLTVSRLEVLAGSLLSQATAV